MTAQAPASILMPGRTSVSSPALPGKALSGNRTAPSRNPAFLDVAESLTGRRWVGPDGDALRMADALEQDTGLPAALCRILADRGVPAGDVGQFLDPRLRDLLPDPRSFRDADIVAARLIRAMADKERVAVFADYDVDGGAAAALLLDWLGQQGHGATLYVPDRITEGYGPNPPAMRKLAEAHDLIVCVDCGTHSLDAVSAARGTDVLIMDHHLAAETLPDAFGVVNPSRQDESGDFTHLCAAAVTFIVLVEANRQLRDSGRDGPDLMEMLDLVALATVADVVPLHGVNRAIVRQGLHVMRARRRPGLAALADVARLTTPPVAYHLGYVIGPCVNAGGRVGRADLGARCLSARDPDEARALADRLEQLNRERREIEMQVRDAAFAQACERGLDGPLIWAAGDNWHPGVVGIVAARLKETARRPAVVIGFDGQFGKGSGRSIAGVDLGHAVQRLQADGLLVRGGGHRMAAGFTIDRNKLPDAMERLAEHVARQGSAIDSARDLRIDSALMPAAATVDLVEEIERAGPFGQGARAPRFAFPDVVIHHARQVGNGHLKLTFGDGLGARVDAIAFNAFSGPLGSALAGKRGQRFHLAGHIEVDHWGGRQSVQLRLQDAAEAHA